MSLLRFPLLSALIALFLGGLDQTAPAANDTTTTPAYRETPAADPASPKPAATPADATATSPTDECPSASASCP